MTGVLYLFGAVLLGAGFIYYAIQLKYGHDESVAMKTFAYSISYLMALFSFLLVDHYIPSLWPE
jgi:protoheme IX farnesyltransferase